MRTIARADIIDLVPYEQGFLYLQKEELPDGNIKASFYAYDQDGNTIFPVTRKNYLQYKFGKYYQKIVDQLDDFVFCEVANLFNHTKVILYPDGDMLQFAPNGKLLQQGKLLYQAAPVSSPCEDGKNMWGVVPEKNAVVNYSFTEKRVLLRIGGGTSNAFNNPVSMSRFLDKLYVCSKDACKIRTVSLENYVVRDYVTFQMPVLKYFRVYDHEYVQLLTGVYLL